MWIFSVEQKGLFQINFLVIKFFGFFIEIEKFFILL